MGSSLTASYRLVYFQPDPEDGERVCVALLFSANGEFEMLYDRAFPKLKCLAPHIDPKLIEVFLDDMEWHLNRRSSSIEFLIKKHAPHLVTSQVRKLAWPLSDTARIHLVQRFLSKGKKGDLVEGEGAERNLKVHLRQLVQNLAKSRIEEIQEGAKPEWVLGRRIPQIRPVALAVRKRGGVLLIDGVNLRVVKPNAVLKQVAVVTHTFWQYGREMEQMEFERHGIRRIGVVINGLQNTSDAYKDAHEFALHEFRREGELAVDTSRPDDLREFVEELSEV